MTPMLRRLPGYLLKYKMKCHILGLLSNQVEENLCIRISKKTIIHM